MSFFVASVALGCLLAFSPVAGAGVEEVPGAAGAAGAASGAAPGSPSADAPSGLTWGQVWGLLAGIVGGGAGGAWLTRRTIARIDPQPLEVTAAKEYATSDYVGKELAKQAIRIDTVATSMAEIKGQMSILNQNQAKILTLLLTHGKS